MSKNYGIDSPTATEYGLIAAFFAIAIITAVGTFGDKIEQFFNRSAEPTTEETGSSPLEVACMMDAAQANEILTQAKRQGEGKLAIYVNNITGDCTTGRTPAPRQ